MTITSVLWRAGSLVGPALAGLIIAELFGVASIPLVGALATVVLDLWISRVAPQLWRFRV